MLESCPCVDVSRLCPEDTLSGTHLLAVSQISAVVHW